jgi:hypothetical protein
MGVTKRYRPPAQGFARQYHGCRCGAFWPRPTPCTTPATRHLMPRLCWFSGTPRCAAGVDLCGASLPPAGRRRQPGALSGIAISERSAPQPDGRSGSPHRVQQVTVPWCASAFGYSHIPHSTFNSVTNCLNSAASVTHLMLVFKMSRASGTILTTSSRCVKYTLNVRGQRR